MGLILLRVWLSSASKDDNGNILTEVILKLLKRLPTPTFDDLKQSKIGNAVKLAGNAGTLDGNFGYNKISKNCINKILHCYYIFFFTASAKHTDIPHVLFDYHAEGGTKKLEKLDSKVAKYIEKLDCFYKTGTTVHKLQSGVIRTNCADCLDRTNAVQLFIGKDCFQKNIFEKFLFIWFK